MFNKKPKTETETYQEPEQAGKAKKKMTATIIIGLSILVVGGLVGGYFLVTYKPNECGKLESDNEVLSGTAPMTINLRSKITGDYQPNMPVCEWWINGAKTSNTVPINGECLMANRQLSDPGKVQIKYNVSSLRGCPQKIDLEVK